MSYHHDRGLYRSSNQGVFGGVCAGVADYFNQPAWLIRILMFSLFVFSGSLGIVIYIAGLIFLDKRPTAIPRQAEMRTPFQSVHDPVSRARELTQRLQQLDRRVQTIERYVTSRRYRFDKEFRDL
jgi:phage shock protein C